MSLFCKKYVAVVVLLLSSILSAEMITLRLPLASDSKHVYFHELLTESCKEIGCFLHIEEVEGLNQKRMVSMVKRGELSLFWLVQSLERDGIFDYVDVGLTNGLIGKRILFIRKGTQDKFDSIRTLKDLQSSGMRGVLGHNWYDVGVWNHNNLPVYVIDGSWASVYKMIHSGRRGIDYFSRGLNEICIEYEEQKELVDIEKKLMLRYNRDLRLYVGPADAHKIPVLTRALKKAKESGLMDRLLDKHFGADFKKLNLDKRIIIDLELP